MTIRPPIFLSCSWISDRVIYLAILSLIYFFTLPYVFKNIAPETQSTEQKEKQWISIYLLTLIGCELVEFYIWGFDYIFLRLCFQLSGVLLTFMV